MKKAIIFILLCVYGSYNVFSQLNMQLLGHLNYQTLHNSGCSNLWGYTDELGNEYAIVGANKGTSIVNINDPNNLTEVYYLPDSNSIWREVRVWGDYAYVSTEAEAGLRIIDLSPLPQSNSLTYTTFFGPPGNQWQTVHSLNIDENGILYIHGANRGNKGTFMYDLNVNPTNPPEVGVYDAYYTHDSYARGDTLYNAHILDGFFTVLDISNKANPVLLAQQTTPFNFTHNCWLSTNGQFLFTTDEKTNAYIAAYDISDLNNIKLVDKIRSNPGSGSIPHNTYYLQGDWLITSYYRDGVVIHDVSDPANMVEVGNYDVSPLSGDGFNSVWGVYAYFNSGKIIASDMENGLYVFSANYVRGCYVSGLVTDAVTTAPLNNVRIKITGNNIEEFTLLDGTYKTGIATAGTYNIIFSKPGYESDTIYNVSLSNGNTTVVNAQLIPLPTFTVTGTVTEQVSGTPIPNAMVNLFNEDFNFVTYTDAGGNYSIPFVIEDTFELIIGKWGYWNDCSTHELLSSTNNVFNKQLGKGYYDDFFFDFGWTITGNADNGIWERGIPIGTTQQSNQVAPANDVSTDCQQYAYVTGNEGGSAGNGDVDGGVTILTSPVFDATIYTNPYVGYDIWFFNGGGFGNPNDTLIIKLTNGSQTVRVKTITKDSIQMSAWVAQAFRIADYLPPGNTMRVIFEAADYGPGHLVEAALDRFYVSEGNQLSLSENNNTEILLNIYPNPATNVLNLTIDNLQNFSENVQVKIFDVTGKEIFNKPITHNHSVINTTHLTKGLYFLSISNEKGDMITRKFIKE